MSALSLAFSTGTMLKVNATPATTSAVPAQPVDLTYAAEKSLPSVVHILSTKNSKVQTVEVESDPFSDFFGDPFGFFGNPQGNGGKQKRSVRTPKQQGSGSGVIISADGYIVTNNHVVADADELTVTLNDNKEYSARIIGTDKTTDLALIKIDGKNLPAITIANSENIKVGEWVLAVGNPFNLTNTVTAGIVSAKGRSLYKNGVESFIQTDAAINPGNSGGALVNTRGELIGINAMLYSQTGSFSGYGFAIPTSIMNKVVDDLKTYGTVQRAVVGIQGSDVKNYVDGQKEQGKDIDLGTMEGIYVAKVTEESAAEEAGLKEGDVIIAIDTRDRLLTCRIDVQKNQLVHLAQRSGEISCEIPGPGIKVRLENRGQLPARENIPHRTDCCRKLLRMMCIIVNVRQLFSIQMNVKSSLDALECPDCVTDNIWLEAIGQTDGTGSDTVLDIDPARCTAFYILDHSARIDEVKREISEFVRLWISRIEIRPAVIEMIPQDFGLGIGLRDVQAEFRDDCPRNL